MRNRVDAGLRDDLARLEFLRHGWRRLQTCRRSLKRSLTGPRSVRGLSPAAKDMAAGRFSAGLDNSMRIATYNVNGINGRLANLLGWLQEAAPDIVCLQELKAPDEKFPAAALRGAGYGAASHGPKSWNGVAILARSAEPVETHRGLP